MIPHYPLTAPTIDPANDQAAFDTIIIRTKAEEYAKALLYDIARFGPMSSEALEIVTGIMLNFVLKEVEE